MVCELVPAGRGPAPAEPPVPSGPTRPGELRQGGAGADLRGSPQDRARRRAVRLLLHQPAGGDQHRRPARRRRSASRRSSTTSRRRPSGQYLLVTKIKKPFSHTDADERLRAGRRDLDARAASVAKKIADLPSREGTTLTGVEPGPRGYRWRADQPATIALGRGARRRRPEEQGAVPRQGRRRSPRRSAASRPRSRKPSGATAASTTPTPASRCSTRTIAPRAARARG